MQLTVSDLRVRERALETAAHARVNTLRFAPARVADADELVRLVARELLDALLHDVRLRERRDLRHPAECRRAPDGRSRQHTHNNDKG